jgi:aspartate-semialdehyde dehydrogenase
MTTPDSVIPVGVLGATGMVGQRLISLLEHHPWFSVVSVAASEKSAGKTYAEAVAGRWVQPTPFPQKIGECVVSSVEHDISPISQMVRVVFSAMDADKKFLQITEEAYAAAGLAVVSNTFAHRWTQDVPMIMPEINPHHLDMLETQRRNRGWNTGCIVTKPNCSIQCYVPLLHAWKAFAPQHIIVSTYQAVSGAGKTLETWPEMVDNVIPYIGGEEEKSEREPSKIWAEIRDGTFVLASIPTISASCIRVPVSDGHMAAVNIRFGTSVQKQELIEAIENFQNPLDALDLPSAPKPLLTYFTDDDRPQTRRDRDLQQGMGIGVGRLRKDAVLGWKCVALSHNTLRGAAGGSVLNAELMLRKGYIR